MRIGVDVMGGDFAPDPILEGALNATNQLESDDVVGAALIEEEEVIHLSAFSRFGQRRRRPG